MRKEGGGRKEEGGREGGREGGEEGKEGRKGRRGGKGKGRVTRYNGPYHTREQYLGHIRQDGTKITVFNLKQV